MENSSQILNKKNNSLLENLLKIDNILENLNKKNIYDDFINIFNNKEIIHIFKKKNKKKKSYIAEYSNSFT